MVGSVSFVNARDKEMNLVLVRWVERVGCGSNGYFAFVTGSFKVMHKRELTVAEVRTRRRLTDTEIEDERESKDADC